MEERRVMSTAMLCLLIMGMVVGQSTAFHFKDCYVPCFTVCLLEHKNVFSCGFSCVKGCIEHPSTLDINTDLGYFCKLGCATSLCANISTKENIGKFSKP
jgi:hypothetical protein